MLRGRRFFGASLFFAVVLSAAAPSAHAFDLSQLMKLLAQQRAGEASFTEQRFVRGLDAPLEASGTLSFAAPDRFTRQTLKPRPESMTVEGNQLTLARGGRTRSLQLDAMPELLGLVEAVRGTLTGNAPLLARHFRSTLAGQERAWTLELVPLAPTTLAAVSKLRIAGEHGELRRIEIELSDGDSSVMTIGALRPSNAASAPRPAS
ncbi:MAG TPA: LolA-related protein [Methylibium sp.]|uniref:LolA-related protein n=1 Tax=Methylibium sp. TaxID=2067992 RepID=UPI002DB77C01|nr:LolA-related protein [Methylibium sp.]HEU4459147.1 LolA-related protein [Methylibium sp.]